MGNAFRSACEALGLANRTDQLTEMVARYIVGLAQRGVTMKTAFYLLTVRGFTTVRDAPAGEKPRATPTGPHFKN